MSENLLKTGSLPVFSDSRGVLFAAEAGKEVPFDIKRVFFIAEVPEGESRGNHIYKYDEFAVCISGSCKIEMQTREEKTIFEMNRPADCVLIPGGSKRKLFDFSPDCRLAVFSDKPYSPDDVITD